MLVEWLITLDCNYSCPYCYLLKQRRISDNQGKIKEILKIFKKNGFSEIDISGGEPFIAENTLIQTINFCAAHDLKIRSISTNGTIFSPKVISSLREVSDLIFHVSLDAATSATYQVMRKSNYFSQVIANIQSFIAADLEVFLGVTVTKINYKEIAMVVDLAEKIGAKGVSLGGFIPLGEGSRLADWCLSKKEMEEVLSVCKNVSKKIKIIGLGDNSCPAGIDKWCALSNGDLYPCALLVNFEEAKVGNLFQKDKFPPSSEWLQKFLEFQPSLECRGCDLPSLCYGGCKAALYAKYYSFPQNQLPICTATKKVG